MNYVTSSFFPFFFFSVICTLLKITIMYVKQNSKYMIGSLLMCHVIKTDKPIEFIREIQQSLVEIGDKDPSFIGSRGWIGAIELSFVLDKLLGVSIFFSEVSFTANINSFLFSCSAY
jgi:hypothetical protein